jgi:hypothetical protein
VNTTLSDTKNVRLFRFLPAYKVKIKHIFLKYLDSTTTTTTTTASAEHLSNRDGNGLGKYIY